jgi:GAF domain-containing protein
VIAVRGFPEPSRVVGTVFRDELSEQIRVNRWPITLPDAQEDGRYHQTAHTPLVRSWAGIPLMVEGEVIGLLCLDRHSVAHFDEEELHRAKAVAFSAAATIRKARLLEQVRRYASLMENLVAVDQAVFAGKPVEMIAQLILEGAVKVGTYRGGLLVLVRVDGARVAAAAGDSLRGALGRTAPAALVSGMPIRLTGAELQDVLAQLGLSGPSSDLYVVPFGTPESPMGTMVLLDPDGETPDDRLMEAYASRAAAALLHAARQR